MSDDKQSGKPDAAADAAAKEAEKPKTLTDLLNEWDESASAKAAKSDDDGGDKKTPDIMKRLEAVEKREARRSYDTTMESVVGTLKGDLDIDSFIVESWINRQADDNPQLLELWDKRESDPAKFDQAIKALKPDFEKFAADRWPTKDKPSGASKSLGAAVRAAKESKVTSAGDDVQDVAGMSDADLALYKAEVFRLAESGELTT